MAGVPTVAERNQLTDPKAVANELWIAVADTDDPAVVVEVEAKLAAFETYMRDAGLFTTEQQRPINETRLRARWRLGQLLAAIERSPGGRGNKNSARTSLLAELKLSSNFANDLQRLGAMPEPELIKEFDAARTREELLSFAYLLKIARPWWAKENRERKHETIAARAIERGATSAGDDWGPYTLLYADPPWSFDTYGEMGKERSPDRHYPTLSDQDIIDFKVGERGILDIVSNPACCFMWCTSANLMRALVVLRGWGFNYASHAVWDKEQIGTGYIFRNQHEVLLYGTRGEMPAPMYAPPSVFRYKRGEHSAKPAEIRKAIEEMFPHFTAHHRLELFARSAIPGWSVYGNQAYDEDAA